MNQNRLESQPQPDSLIQEIKTNIKEMKFNMMELSGGLGDLGTFIPLMAGMALVSNMDIGTILIFAGLFNIITGILFGLPIPVQPMKAIAAVAIAETLMPSEIMAAGLIAGAVVFILGTTGWINNIENHVPKVIIRGIQLGVGMKLCIKGIYFIKDTPLVGYNSIVTAVTIALVVLFFRNIKKFPAALLMFFFGIGVLFYINPSITESFSLGFTMFSISSPPPDSWMHGFLFGAVPQIPLTILNSVLAVCLLSGDLFPGNKIPTSKMATSVGIMNLISCWFGAIPMCHGSGGLAGQYRFGARTGGSVVLLGISKILLGLFWGVFITQIILNYPLSILGVMLFFAGLELAKPSFARVTPENRTVLIVTALGIIFLNTLVGFLAGVFMYMILIQLKRIYSDTGI